MNIMNIIFKVNRRTSSLSELQSLKFSEVTSLQSEGIASNKKEK